MKKLVLAALTVLALTACSEFNDERGKGDAPVEKRDDGPAEVVNFPDGFSNVAHKCDGHGHRIYVTTQANGGKQMTVIADPSCPGGGEQ